MRNAHQAPSSIHPVWRVCALRSRASRSRVSARAQSQTHIRVFVTCTRDPRLRLATADTMHGPDTRTPRTPLPVLSTSRVRRAGPRGSVSSAASVAVGSLDLAPRASLSALSGAGSGGPPCSDASCATCAHEAHVSVCPYKAVSRIKAYDERVRLTVHTGDSERGKPPPTPQGS